MRRSYLNDNRGSFYLPERESLGGEEMASRRKNAVEGSRRLLEGVLRYYENRAG